MLEVGRVVDARGEHHGPAVPSRAERAAACRAAAAGSGPREGSTGVRTIRRTPAWSRPGFRACRTRPTGPAGCLRARRRCRRCPGPGPCRRCAPRPDAAARCPGIPGRHPGEENTSSAGHDPFGDGALVVVEVVEEVVQGCEALAQAGLDAGPLRAGEHPGDDVEGPGAVDVAVRLGVDGEGHAVGRDVVVRRPLEGEQVVEAELGDRSKIAPVPGPGVARRVDQLVMAWGQVLLEAGRAAVVTDQHSMWPFPRGCFRPVELIAAACRQVCAGDPSTVPRAAMIGPWVTRRPRPGWRRRSTRSR